MDRGIKVSKEWNIFENFIRDVGERPSILHSIDRIDNDKGYEPGNCKWSTPKEQARNRSNSVLIEYNGKYKTMGEWSIVFGIKESTLKTRLRLNWCPERIFNERPRKHGTK